MRRSIPIAALALAACEVYSVPNPETCPGTKVGTFTLAYGDAGTTCPSQVVVNNPPPQVGATLTYQADGGAAICLDRSHAVPFYGTHLADHVVVQNVDPTAPVTGCSGCTRVLVTNVIEGDVLRNADGGFVGFTSRWLSLLDAPDGSTPDTDGGGLCGCALPCQVLYTADGGT